MVYIDLSRRFRDLTESELEAPELLAPLNDSRWEKVPGMSVGWAELLQHPRVLILAEAGSGKTAEMQEQTTRLTAEGNAAFFTPLEALDREPFEEILSCNENRTWGAWKREGESPGWFFLDAIDELKLTQGKLDRALNRLAKALDGHLHRAHCIISCRPSDFSRSVDLASVHSQLPFTPSQQIAQPDSDEAFLAPLRERGGGGATKEKKIAIGKLPRTVVLLPLSKGQISTFVRSQGVTDTDALIDEVNRRDAWIFTRRPGDLINLIAFWKANGQLGTRAEQHEANVRAKLADKPDRPDHGVLSDDRARSGAERLALALALTRTRTIRAPEQEPGTEWAEGVIDPAAILSDWTQEQRQALLRRALFDPATYGRVRFHHRSVQEYLAACKLKELREKGMPVKNLHRLLFAELYGESLVKPSMQAIAAWLALWDDDVRRELMEREPETLLSMGDPQSLSMGDRAQLLRTFFRRYGEGGWRGLDIPIDEVRRLADPALGGVVREIWNAKPASPDVTELLLEIIWQGSIDECADIARTSAFDTSQPDTHRVFAIRALVACGRTEALHGLRDSILHEPEIWPDCVVDAVAENLFPSALSVADLMTLIQRRNKPQNSTHGLSWAMREIAEEIDPLSAAANELRDGLAELIWNARHKDQEWYHLRGHLDHIAPALARLCDRQLEAMASTHTPDERLIWSSVVANQFDNDETGARDLIQGLKKHFESRPALREAAFWSELKLTKEATQSEDFLHQYYSQAVHRGLLNQPVAGDRAWLLDTLGDSQIREHRLAALHALVSLWAWGGKEAASLDELVAAVSDDEELAKILHQRSTPSPPDLKLEEWQQRERREKLEREDRERQRLEKWVRWKEQLLADPEGAFMAEELRTTAYNLYQWLESRQDSISRYNVWDEDALLAAFGDDIARRTAKAFQATWRAHPPIPWSQRPAEDRDRTLRVWTEGLTGLAAEATTPGWAARLTQEEARVAAAYATVEINELPGWLSNLAAAHPIIVDEVVGGELTAELAKNEGRPHLPILQELAHTDISVKRLLAHRLLDWLPKWPSAFQDDQCGRQSAHHLRQVLGILHEVIGSQEREAVTELCSRQLSDNPNGPLALTWLRGLFRFDPEKATQALEDGLASLPELERSGRAIATFGDLFGHRDVVPDFADDGRRAASLSRLVCCAYRYVRPAEDQEHEGTYTPDVRDDAESARNLLLTALLDTPGTEARKNILDLAKEPIFAHFPDRLLLLARHRAARDAESAALRPADVVTLEKRFEAPPHDRDSLFTCMVDRLDDLAHDIAHDDFSDRRTLRTIRYESEMQLTLARRLRDAAKGAYIVSREDEVADLKRTDIRLAATRCDQKAVIEVKIADDRWSLADLERALREQLVGQYLRHATCKAGCLLLTYNGTKSYWKHSITRKQLSFAELTEHLSCLAQAIEHELGYEVRLAVFPLDLTDPPLKPLRQ